jgi:hypothetical protein
MAVSYPTSIVNFTTRVNTTQVIYAEHINDLQNEVMAIETALGASSSTTLSLRTSTWPNGTAFAFTTSWGTLAERLNNIESGLMSYGALAAPHPLLLAGM